ncbi:hypothetical protein GLU60_02065 [Nanohaloarchaea archaeon H01]|nr:hypothetical protein [Nanohaloarchaea archaeon H01]
MEVASEISEFEQVLEDELSGEYSLEADYSFNTLDSRPSNESSISQATSFDSIEELIKSEGVYDNLLTGKVSYTVGESTGEVFYDSGAERTGRIETEFNVPDDEVPEVENAIERAVHDNFNSFAGWDLPGKNPRQYVEELVK